MSTNDPSKKLRRLPRDPNQLARAIVQIATGERDEKSGTPTEEPPAETETPEKDPHAVALGRLGGKKGGTARAATLSPERRREIARAAAKKRWSSK